MRPNVIRAFWLSATFAILSACGGGGGGTEPPAQAVDGPNQPGTATFVVDEATYEVNQDAQSLVVQVARTGSVTESVSVDYASADETAVAELDYVPVSGTLTWAALETTPKSITLPIKSTAVFDGIKTLKLALSNPSAGARLGTPAASTISIRGLGGAEAPPSTPTTPTSPTSPVPGPGVLSLANSKYTVSQTIGSVSIVVQRLQGSSGEVAVRYATANGTATAGTHYTARSGTLTWSAGDATPKTVSIPISATAALSGTKSFSVALSGASGGATISSPSSATVTIDGAGVSGVLAFNASSTSVEQGAGSVALRVTRGTGSNGAVSVAYSTADATAKAGVDYTSKSGVVNWAAGETAAKTVSIPISNAAGFVGSKTFSVALSDATGGASIGTPNVVTVTINGSGSGAGAFAFAKDTYSVPQSSGSVSVAVTRSGGGGSASVEYATSDGTAVAGSDYTGVSGKLSWAAGETSKTFTIAVNANSPFTGSKTFNVKLSNPAGAVLGTSSAVVTIVGSGSANTGPCEKSSQSWVTTGIFDSKRFGNYVVNNNNWGGTPNQQLWANSESCWGVTTNATTERYSIGSYPSVTRGWSQNASIMQELSTPGTNDWTTKSGMGIPVGQLTKAKARWAFTAPSAPAARWLGLMDVYLHKKNNPSPSEFPPFVDLMIDQALADQPVNDTTYYALVAGNANATTVTLGGVTYLVYIDDPGEAIYHQSGGHTIHLFATPTDVTHKNGPNWGTRNGTTDVAAIVKYFMQSNPKDDAGRPLRTASGATVTSPLIASNLYLNAINAGWEIDFGTQFKNSKFCVAMQGEPDC